MSEAPHSSLEVYQGREGYARMFQELRDSFYEQMPDARGRIEIVNPLADPTEELARINASLGLTGEKALTLLPSGQTFSDSVPGKGTVSIAGGWGVTASDDLSPASIELHASTLIHEIGHALLRVNEVALNDKEKNTTVGRFDSNQSSEAFADTMRQAMMLRNFPDQTASIKSMIAGYDTYPPTRNYSATGDLLVDLLQRHPHPDPSDNGYRLKGWKAALDESMDIFKKAEIFKPEAKVQMNLMMLRHDDAISDAIVRNMASQSDAVKSAFNDPDLKHIVSSIMKNPDEYTFMQVGGEIPDSLKGTGFVEKLLEGMDKKLEWLESNKDVFGDYAGRQIDGFNYMLGRSTEVRPHTYNLPQNITIQEFFAKTLLRYAETGDPEYLAAAKSSAKMNLDSVFVAAINDPAKLDYLSTHANILKLIAEGTRYQDIKMPQDFPTESSALQQTPLPSMTTALTPVP